MCETSRAEGNRVVVLPKAVARERLRTHACGNGAIPDVSEDVHHQSWAGEEVLNSRTRLEHGMLMRLGACYSSAGKSKWNFRLERGHEPTRRQRSTK